jgi:HAMP domain-containing protein
LEDGIDNNILTVGDVFDKNYTDIKGYNWNGVPRYHTRYDSYTDNVMVAFLDRFLVSEDIIAALGADINGYVPTHNSKYMQAFTGEAGKDLVNNRSKRMFKDDVAVKAAKNENAVLVQVYHRDTGELAWDVSSPVYVKGKHWGCFRAIVSSAQIEKRRSELIWGLTAMFGAFAAITAAMIFVMLRQSMKPLIALTDLADTMSLGEGLENPIKPQTVDEVGRMTKAVDRLRASLKAAMSRLGE